VVLIGTNVIVSASRTISQTLGFMGIAQKKYINNFFLEKNRYC
jgi:hypothetical protein